MRVLARYVGNNHLIVEDSNPQDQFVPGHEYWIDVKRPNDRNAKHHRKFWAMLRYFRGFLERDISDKALASWVIIGAGWFELMPDGTRIAQSIAFSNMPQAEFNRLYSASLDYLLAAVAPETLTREDVETALRFA
jgi:hypothetical protein